MKQLFLALVLSFISTFAFSQTIDQDNSVVNFSIRNMRIKNVKGSIKGMKGKIVFDENNLSNSIFDVSVDVATIDTKNKTRDKHLKNEDFFNLEKYPQIHFTSTEIRKEKNSFVTIGQMTLHGVTKEVSIPFSVSQENNATTLKGEIEIDRFDFGLGAEKYDGTFMVGKVAKIEIIGVVTNEGEVMN